MTEIPFTQYLMPDGRKRNLYFMAAPDTLKAAARLIDGGYAFEAEILTTGEVSLTVSDGEEDIAIQLCPNGPGIGKYVDALVKEAAEIAECAQKRGE